MSVASLNSPFSRSPTRIASRYERFLDALDRASRLPPTPVESQWLLNSDSAIRREIPLDGVTRRAVEVASTVNASPRAPVLSVVPARVAGENRLPVRYRGHGRTLRFSIMGRAVFSKVGNQAVDR